MKKKNEHTKQRILHNALKIFTKKGFFRAKVEDIAKASGVAKGTVYLYFKDKSSLYVGVIQEHFITGITYLKELQKAPLSSTEILRTIADTWIDYMIYLRSSFFMFSMENLNLSGNIMKAVRPIVAENIASMIDIIAEIIDKGVHAGEFRKIDTHIAALHFLNTMRTGVYINLFIPHIAVDKQAAVDLFFEGLNKRR